MKHQGKIRSKRVKSEPDVDQAMGSQGGQSDKSESGFIAAETNATHAGSDEPPKTPGMSDDQGKQGSA